MGLFTALSQKVLSLLISPSIRGFVKAQMQVRCPATICAFEKLYLWDMWDNISSCFNIICRPDGIFRKKPILT